MMWLDQQLQSNKYFSVVIEFGICLELLRTIHLIKRFGKSIFQVDGGLPT